MVDAIIAIYNRTVGFFFLPFHFLLLPFYFLLLISCEKSTTAPPPPGPEIVLSLAEEPYLTEISLKLELRNLPLPQHILITRDDSPIFNDTMAANDTTVTDAGLRPATGYSYRAYRMVEGQKTDSSALLPVSTMDTTSHDFQWEIIEFPSSYGSGVLRDVAIINENDIWAVGEIYSDSAQPWLPYNAVHWNGQQWELKRIMKTGNSIISSIRGIWVFSENNIWLAAGSVYHWTGGLAQLSYQRDINTLETVEKLWANSPSDIYGVGNAGLIVHYDGRRWQKLESGTDVMLTDVWGTPDGSEAWACGWETSKPTVLLAYQNGQWQKIYENYENRFQVLEDTLSGSLSSGWVFDDRSVYVASNAGVYKIPTSGYGKIKRLSFRQFWFPGFPFRLRGNGVNDMILVGDRFMAAHFNGWSWRHYEEFTDLGAFLSTAQKGGLVCSVGLRFDLLGQAVILIGRR